MSNALTTPYLNQLPLELLHRIFYHLDVPDIVRIRRVSRYLNEASRYRNVWSDAYRRAEIVRPPGPFPSQSARDLENVLISNFRIHRNFRHYHCDGPSKTKTPTFQHRRIRHRDVVARVRLIFGRFLLVALDKEVHCYDLNLRILHPSIIYHTNGGLLGAFHCVSAIDPEGRPFACVILSEEVQTTKQISIYSLNVGEQSKVSLELLHQFQYSLLYVNTVHLGPRAIIIQGERGHDIIAMDVHAHTLLLIPSFSHAILKAAEVTEPSHLAQPMPTSISTSTHLVLAASYSFNGADGWRTFFQAFALPPPNPLRHSTSTAVPLSPSHSSIIFGMQLYYTVLLHDSVVDPITQDVLIVIGAYISESSGRPFLLKQGILRLSAPTSHDHEVGTITLQLVDCFGQLPRMPLLRSSFNGTGRVFYMSPEGTQRIVSAAEYNLCTSCNDGDQQAANVVEYPSILRLPSPCTIMDYDPYSCRICFKPTGVDDLIDIFDLAA